jgi:hypothetical protein
MTMVSAVLKCIIFWHSLTVIHRRTTGFLYLYFLSVACTLLLQDHECAYLDTGKVHVMQNWISSTSLLQVGHATYRVPYLNLICVHRPHRRVLEAKAKGKSQKCYWSLFIPTTLCWAVNIYHSELNCGVSQKSIFFLFFACRGCPITSTPPSKSACTSSWSNEMRRGKKHYSQVHVILQASFCSSIFSELSILYLIIL